MGCYAGIMHVLCKWFCEKIGVENGLFYENDGEDTGGE